MGTEGHVTSKVLLLASGEPASAPTSSTCDTASNISAGQRRDGSGCVAPHLGLEGRNDLVRDVTRLYRDTMFGSQVPWQLLDSAAGCPPDVRQKVLSQLTHEEKNTQRWTFPFKDGERFETAELSRPDVLQARAAAVLDGSAAEHV